MKDIFQLSLDEGEIRRGKDVSLIKSNGSREPIIIAFLGKKNFFWLQGEFHSQRIFYLFLGMEGVKEI